ncbi:pilus (MSHA type) biogenesis protein MshL [Vibrio diazotrophicus]|uniref:MSHA biogenesis protein MshL n=1 Tax=Vibrio diazotrophicus TaxID=685 RepID=A0A329EBE0_VIBDI|nr:pilus (MSHA type) biogenesis protein MshL [Vibrio diazotrophicus]RAS64500.1 MSHA biogenesis protein MshL [Vibrio diazotrophicus]
MRKIVIGVMLVSLVGCSMGHRDPVEAKQSLNQAINEANSRNLDNLPASVEADLMPDMEGVTSTSERNLKRFRIQANGVEAKAFFASLVKGTEYSVAIHPSVEGRVTVNLSEVTLDEALDVVRDLYGYQIEKVGKVIQVYPAGLRTVTIPVDFLSLKRSGRSLTSVVTGTTGSSNSGSNNNSSSSNSSDNGNDTSNRSTISGGTTISTENESNFWPQLQTAVSRLVGSGKGQSVVVMPQASVISLRAYPDEIREVRRFLGISQDRIQRQVIMEAKILEVTLNDGFQQGINWTKLFNSNGTQYAIGAGDTSLNSTASTLGGAVSALPGLGTIGTLLGGQTNIVMSSGSFEAVLSFMATQGDLNVLSSPRVTAVNNQKAMIKVGSEAYYITSLSSDTGDGDNSESSTDVELTQFFSGITLDVTPQIDDKGKVLLHVHPAVIDVEEENKIFVYNGKEFSLPLAKSSIRESDSVIHANDGDVVVIGGLMKSNTINQTSKVPFLGDIPLLGHAFRNTSQATQKTELVILLKPTVVGVNTWQKELERSRDLLQEWFPDSE